MIADASLRWICTALFVFAAGFHVCSIVATPALSALVSQGIHLSMCAAMIVMAWPWGLFAPILPQAVFFCASTVWFAAAAINARSTADRSNADGHDHGPTVSAYHAFMMAAMV